MLLLGNSEWHQVESIALQATTLLRWDGVKAPPAVLSVVAVCSDLRACRRMHASLSLMTHISTHIGHPVLPCLFKGLWLVVRADPALDLELGCRGTVYTL